MPGVAYRLILVSYPGADLPSVEEVGEAETPWELADRFEEILKEFWRVGETVETRPGGLVGCILCPLYLRGLPYPLSEEEVRELRACWAPDVGLSLVLEDLGKEEAWRRLRLTALDTLPNSRKGASCG